MNVKLQALRSLIIDPSSNYAAVAAAIAAVVVLVLILVFSAVALILPSKHPRRQTDSDGRRRHAGSTAVFFGVSALGLALAGAIWYQTTSSVEYCANTCHAMAASAASWKASPHGSVSCVRCHEGSGPAAIPEAVSTRLNDLYLTAFDHKAGLRYVPAGRCLDCHSTVLDMPLTARNGETFLHRDALSSDTPCESCHGAQGHIPSRL